MPVTPRFTLTQSDEFVMAKVHVPYVRVSSTELRIGDCELMLWCRPYLLKLRFPHALVEDERARAVYDVNDSNGTLTVYMPKAEPGLFFEGLNMTAALLQRSLPPKMVARLEKGPEALSAEDDGELGSDDFGDEPVADAGEAEAEHTFGAAAPARVRPLIEEIESLAISSSFEDDAPAPPAAAAAPALSEAELELVKGPAYGFARATRGFFARLGHSDDAVLSMLTELPTPDKTPSRARAALRRRAEETAFDGERYAADTLCAADADMVVGAARTYIAPWMTRQAQLAGPGEQVWTEDEMSEMLALPRNLREAHIALGVRLGGAREWQIACALLDVLLARCYDDRLTQGEPNVESAWTVCTLSPTLSWLHSYAAPEMLDGEARKAMARAAVVAVARRICCFPFLRSWDMVRRAMGDVLGMLLCAAPRFAIVRNLLALRRVIKVDESRYLLNKLYLDDYAVWAQGSGDASGGVPGAAAATVCGLRDDVIAELAAALKDAFLSLSKDELGLGLVSAELAAARKQVASTDSDDDTDYESDGAESDAACGGAAAVASTCAEAAATQDAIAVALAAARASAAPPAATGARAPLITVVASDDADADADDVPAQSERY
jgi:protein SHQ1